MDMQSQMTRPYDHDQAEDPIRIHHPEEEEHQEKGATKVLKKVKEKAKKIKNSLTKHGQGHEHNHDVEIEDDDNDEQDPQLHGAPVHIHGGVTGQPESLSHPGEASVPAPEEIVPPGTKAFPVVSSDYTKPVEPEPLRETLYRHEAASYPADISDRDESREAHQTPMKTPASLLSATEDVTGTFTHGEDEYLDGQRRVNVERPKGLEEDPAGPGGGSSYLSGVTNYQSKVTDPTHAGGGEAGVPEIVESLGRMKVTDEKPGRGFESDFPTRSHEFEDPTQIHHPEEEEHHESRASKMLGKVKAKAKKLKNRLTNHGIDGNEQDHDVVDEEEEDDESDEAESEKHVAPVNEVSNVRGYRTSQPESLTHPGENNVPAPEEIIPSETKDSTNYTRTVPEPSRDAAYEHEAPLYPVRTSEVLEREESRETHHAPLNTPVSLLSGTEDPASLLVESLTLSVSSATPLLCRSRRRVGVSLAILDGSASLSVSPTIHTPVLRSLTTPPLSLLVSSTPPRLSSDPRRLRFSLLVSSMTPRVFRGRRRSPTRG
ncbi:hypothetical protein F2Q68_00008262 [Brassica cretica]|uniref:Low-temperature-induced 65 kDa protein n=1 Tax=Brassica cretica TaxID=69181 RepID=A0A8S9KU14_BRACR|nr:hypothetical protein F2Q68_00008262 [Brassica cretica]